MSPHVIKSGLTSCGTRTVLQLEPCSFILLILQWMVANSADTSTLLPLSHCKAFSAFSSSLLYNKNEGVSGMNLIDHHKICH